MAIPTPSVNEGIGGTPDDNYEFVDEPLDPFVQDNLEIDCLINGLPYHVVELEVHLTDGAESNYAIGQVVGQGHNEPPTAGDPLNDVPPDRISVDVDNELMEVRPNVDGEITRIFTGVISNSSRVQKGLYEFMAFQPSFSLIQNGTLTFQHPAPDREQLSVTDGGSTVSRPVYTNRHTTTNFISQEIVEYVTQGGPEVGPSREERRAETEFGWYNGIKPEGYQIANTGFGTDLQVNVSSKEVPIVIDGNDEGILERVVRASNSVWEVDRYGHFLIGAPTPDGDEPTSITSHKLRYITETTAGKQSPAWQSIVVIGDGVVSQDGWAANAQLAENPQRYDSPLTIEGELASVDGQLAEPVFEYTNLEINTAEEAEHVLEKLKEEIKKQQASGEITVVGHPEVWPGDSVELPDSENQPFGLERFAVSKVIHRINNSDGFTTKIEVMGQTNANEALFSDELPVPDDIPYDGYVTESEADRLQSGDVTGL